MTRLKKHTVHTVVSLMKTDPYLYLEDRRSYHERFRAKGNVCTLKKGGRVVLRLPGFVFDVIYRRRLIAAHYSGRWFLL